MQNVKYSLVFTTLPTVQAVSLLMQLLNACVRSEHSVKKMYYT